jgi:hypothetical protein
VLVVGAGPTGLVLAAELLARGIRTRVIDKGAGVALQTRAIGIHARTLEVLDMMGLADRVTHPDRRPYLAGPLAGAARPPASACPISPSGPSASPPLCTRLCAAAGTCS